MTKSFSEALAAELATPRPTQCQTCKILQSLNDDERRTFDAALGDGVPLISLTRALRSLGYAIGDESISQHLKRGHTV